ncbi:hypothetical protein [Bifidobacterium phasiani]|uniref:hypothetical protein n=1 Tax=Bifidobacterium phasiani TaxID=2834431 RepID=UPI001F3685B0|nr:hypothetical protein [Bifidobacterium phasiani]
MRGKETIDFSEYLDLSWLTGIDFSLFGRRSSSGLSPNGSLSVPACSMASLRFGSSAAIPPARYGLIQ